MRVLLFGATGMVGEGVLLHLLEDSRVTAVTVLVRRPIRHAHPKLTIFIEPDLFHIQHADQLTGFDACLFCLGTSSVGMSEADYRHTTHDLTLSIAAILLPRNPSMVFEFITGGGTSASSRQMWARVKAETEKDLLAFGFRDAYMLRPGYIHVPPQVQPRVRWMRWFYRVMYPLYPLLQRFPTAVTSSERLALAMLRLAEHPQPLKIIESREINRLGTL